MTKFQFHARKITFAFSVISVIVYFTVLIFQLENYSSSLHWIEFQTTEIKKAIVIVFDFSGGIWKKIMMMMIIGGTYFIV